MEENFIDLTDGTRLSVKVNFGTIYYLQKCKGYYRIQNKLNKLSKQKGSEKPRLSEGDSFELAADLIYAILRSNKKIVTFDEALALVPPDPEGIADAISFFQEEFTKYSKKKQAKVMQMPR